MGALLYFAFWALLIFVMMRFGCGAHVMGHGQHGAGSNRGADGDLRWTPPDKDTDPVCGKTVNPSNAKPSVYDGIVYYFCSRDCREQFEAMPQSYVSKEKNQASSQLEHHHG